MFVSVPLLGKDTDLIVVEIDDENKADMCKIEREDGNDLKVNFAPKNVLGRSDFYYR